MLVPALTENVMLFILPMVFISAIHYKKLESMEREKRNMCYSDFDESRKGRSLALLQINYASKGGQGHNQEREASRQAGIILAPPDK